MLLLLLTLPTLAQAQFNYTTNNGTITITGYTGPGGAVTIPDRIPDTTSGLPVTSIADWAFFNCTNLTSVTIPGSVTNVGNGAFNGCTNLSSVTIPDSVTSLGAAAFGGCTGLSSVTIPDSVTSLGGAAFGGCTGLTNATIGNRVTSIGIHTFLGCTSLMSVTIGNHVTRVELEAFVGCTSLTGVTIPNSVTNIASYAFYLCTNLRAITVEADNPAYSGVAGVLFDKSQAMLVQCPEGRAGSYIIPNNVGSIGDEAFEYCTRLTSVTIPNSVINIGYEAFRDCTGLTSVTVPDDVANMGEFAFSGCTSLTNVTIGNQLTSIGLWAFASCTNLTSVTIGNSVTSIWDDAFYGCTSLTAIQFNGNAPNLGGSSVFLGDNNATVYYLPGTTGWGTSFGGRPTVLWNPPTIQMSPQTQTAEAGSAVGLHVDASGSSPLFCLWYLDSTNLISCSTNRELDLTSVQFSQSGAYTVVISNVLGTVTSAPAMLNLITPVERRPVPGVKLTGQAGSSLNVDYANSLSPAPNWAPLSSVSLTSTSQYYFDLTVPLPPQRYFRAWQTGTPGVMPSLDLHLVPAITLTGNTGASVRVDYINRFGPTDAWVTLNTVTLTNTSQLYFDISAPGQPQRLYRLVPLP